MPALSSHQSAKTTKLLLLGDSGTGKSGALASLASAGYNLRILDLDNGIDVLANILRDPSNGYAKDSLSRVWYETLTDPMKPSAGGKLVPSKATVWQRAVKLLENWKITEQPKGPDGALMRDEAGKLVPPVTVCDFGPITSWTSQEVLVVDTLSFLCNAAMNFQLSMNNRLGGRVEQSDWYVAQQMIESLLQMLYDENVKCNVIVNCHIQYTGGDGQPERGHAQTLGKALTPKVGRYFNTVLMARTTGSGTAVKRQILTTSTSIVELKNTNPSKVPAAFDLKTGLADYFKLVREG